jgi:outer membrane protein OmpU
VVEDGDYEVERIGFDWRLLLSKRTDVYLSANYLKSSGGANAALWTETPSSNQKQLALRVGMRHKF